MLVTNGILLHRFEEVVHEGQRLGRHLALDARSLAYAIERELEVLAGVSIRPADHHSPLPVLDQGNLGSCTGNAGTYATAALVGAAGLNRLQLHNLALSGNAVLDEKWAVELYSDATVDDGFPGTYPPDDTGSSGLGVARALKAAGLIGRYVWATSLQGFATLLQRGGVLMGTPWLEAWFEPDADGFVDSDPGWVNTPVAGGHEVYVEALESWDDRDPHASVIRFRNSWGDEWGDHGSGRMRLSTYVLLKSQGIDLKQLADLKV
jgi:hypothetical protein